MHSVVMLYDLNLLYMAGYFTVSYASLLNSLIFLWL